MPKLTGEEFLNLSTTMAVKSNYGSSSKGYRPSRQEAKARLESKSSSSGDKIGRRGKYKPSKSAVGLTSTAKGVSTMMSSAKVQVDGGKSKSSPLSVGAALGSHHGHSPGGGGGIGLGGRTSPGSHVDASAPTAIDKLTNIADQRIEILNRVEAMTVEYGDGSEEWETKNEKSATEGDEGNQARQKGKLTGGGDQTKSLRTNIGNAIDAALELQSMNGATKESLNSLLDWFFDLRSLDASDDIDGDEAGKVFEQDAQGLLKGAEDVAGFLKENKKVVGKVGNSLQKILKDARRNILEKSQKLTASLTNMSRMKDVDLKRMERDLTAAQEGLEKINKVNVNMEKTLKSQALMLNQVGTSRKKEQKDWEELSRDFSDRVVHLEKLLAHESSKSKMMEQILRAGGLELHMEIKDAEADDGGGNEGEDDESKAHIEKMLSMINDLKDQVQSKDLELSTERRKFEAEMSKMQSSLKMVENSQIENGKAMLGEIDEFKQKFIKEMGEEVQKKDDIINKMREQHEAQLTRMRDLLAEAESVSISC